MTAFRDTDDPLDQLDRGLRELTRRHERVLTLEAFRRQLERPSDQHSARQTSPGADTQTANQLGHELDLAFTDFGGATLALAHRGALNDQRLAPRVRRIHEPLAQLDALAGMTPVSSPSHRAAAQHAATA